MNNKIEFSPTNMKMWQRMGMSGSNAIVSYYLAENTDNILFTTADFTNSSGYERLKKDFPEKIYNVGIAEQNLIGFSAGLSNEGYTVFASSYAAFITARCLEQIKVNLAYMKSNVKIIGLASGLASGVQGTTHAAVEDISFIRALPNIDILSPCDTTEAIKSILASTETNRPTYIRLSSVMNLPLVYTEDYNFEIGKAIKILEFGKDISIIATGTMVKKAMDIANSLKDKNIKVRVYNFHTIKPLDINAITECLDSKLIVTMEEHSIIGGLGSAVAEVLAEKNIKPPQLIIGIESYYELPGDYEYLISKYKLNTADIEEKIINKFNEL